MDGHTGDQHETIKSHQYRVAEYKNVGNYQVYLVQGKILNLKTLYSIFFCFGLDFAISK